MTRPVYLDHQATTPVDPRVVEAMAPFWTERFGHPASQQHAFGWDAEKAAEAARAEVAALVGAEPREIVFTSGGAEADNLALKGAAETLHTKGRHVVTTAIENRPVRECAAWLEARGFGVTTLGVDADGRVDADAVAAALRDDTILVSVELASHEVGTVQDIEAIGRRCRERGVWLHTDATHAAAWVGIDVKAQGIDLLSLTGHRMYGPKGIGALYVRRRAPRVQLAPQILGGEHERGRRGGTLNVPGAVGLGRACALCREEQDEDARRVGALRDRFERTLREGVEGVSVLAAAAPRLPHVSALTVEGVEGESLVLGASGVAFATGSACTSATLEASHVLRAMGLSKRRADASVRFGLGRFTTAEDVERALAAVGEAIGRIRAAGGGSRPQG